ncbi:uncharacterized protein LOC125536514 isoform X2 [Triticum urartu]|uniref:Uncharacterized protein n=2 Tax=Triticum urartu TaxID=4572 RepID=A0A8R7PC97_TRIUA|nr:uncharacterized protein LOC125536514 isoform X2 [Triticum urartu]
MIRFIGLLLLGLISLLHRNFSPGAFQFRELNLTLQIIRQHSTLLRKGTSENIFLSLVETELKITPFRLAYLQLQPAATTAERTSHGPSQEWLTESSVHISEAKRGVGVEDLTQFGSNYCYLSNRSFSPRLLVVRP